MTYEQLLSPLVHSAIAKYKLILLSHLKLLDFYRMLNETDDDSFYRAAVATTVIIFSLSGVTWTQSLWCQQRQWRQRQQTISFLYGSLLLLLLA